MATIREGDDILLDSTTTDDQVAYPLDDTPYTAADAQLWHSTRTQGVFSSDEDFIVTSTGELSVAVSMGLAWIKAERFKNVVFANKSDKVLEFATADGLYNRTDRVVARWDMIRNTVRLGIKQGTPSKEATPPALERGADAYEISFADVLIRAGTLGVAARDITDTRLDDDLCGIMRDGVTGIPTQQLYDQWKDWYRDMTTNADMVWSNWLSEKDEQLQEYPAGEFITKLDELYEEMSGHTSDPEAHAEITAPIIADLTEHKTSTSAHKQLFDGVVKGTGTWYQGVSEVPNYNKNWKLTDVIKNLPAGTCVHFNISQLSSQTDFPENYGHCTILRLETYRTDIRFVAIRSGGATTQLYTGAYHPGNDAVSWKSPPEYYYDLSDIGHNQNGSYISGIVKSMRDNSVLEFTPNASGANPGGDTYPEMGGHLHIFKGNIWRNRILFFSQDGEIYSRYYHEWRDVLGPWKKFPRGYSETVVNINASVGTGVVRVYDLDNMWIVKGHNIRIEHLPKGTTLVTLPANARPHRIARFFTQAVSWDDQWITAMWDYNHNTGAITLTDIWGKTTINSWSRHDFDVFI